MLNLCNAVYNHMLRMLGTVYESVDDGTRGRLLSEAIGMMHVLSPLNELLTRMDVSSARSGEKAGMSFAVTRGIAPPRQAQPGSSSTAPSLWPMGPAVCSTSTPHWPPQPTRWPRWRSVSMDSI